MPFLELPGCKLFYSERDQSKFSGIWKSHSDPVCSGAGQAGGTPGMIRFSVGLDTLDDILRDIDNALSATAKA